MKSIDSSSGTAMKKQADLPIEVERFVLRKSEIAVIPLSIQATLKREQSHISQLILDKSNQRQELDYN